MALREDDHGAILATVAIAGVFITAAAVIGKLIQRRDFAVRKKYDYVLLLGVVLVFAQSGVAVYAAALGLGRSRENVESEALSTTAKWAASEDACAAAVSINNFIHISSMITDVSIICFSLAMVVRVQTSIGAKLLIISLFSTRILDFTWLGLGPTAWLIANSHISIVCTVIPSLKGMFDSFLGNTLGLGIDAPYQLERIHGKDGFEVSAYDRTVLTASRRNSGSHSKVNSSSRTLTEQRKDEPTNPIKNKGSGFIASSAAALKLTTFSPTEVACFSENTASHRRDDHPIGAQDKAKNGQSESVKGLTDGVIMIHSESRSASTLALAVIS
ncbi:hypothetical protein Micbo1qcDRAFT_199550 [Microdochium bolleyi]|uniref:Integral membrane protein n=1 Tax=Microdochium bolleyi TaxID=196109 RepID=A0A136JHZ9_9PEZI|nr:hypothetical protein Micbo1qcDRAFT_199550 [Microdochium bolleyi]